MSSRLKAELAATCSTLGRLHKGDYLIEPECIESVKDLIRYLKRDNEAHEIRRYLGESKVLQNDLVYIIKSCPEDNSELFDVTLRLLINLTTPTMLFYEEDVPTEKIGRNIYLSLIGYSQDYKAAFCDVEFWSKICGKLTDLFETDWSERSADDGIKIERILMLLRNVLHIPADRESEKRPENDTTVHDKILWALRQSQILELLLFISSNKNEEQYYLNLLEIFSLILREQNPKKLAHCDIQHSALEKNQDTEELTKVRELEKNNRNKYVNMRNFRPTFVMKGVKSLSDNDVVCHKPLEKVNQIDINNFCKKQIRSRKNCVPVESGCTERRSIFSVRLFLKEFCLEFLNCSFNHFMCVIKNKLDTGKSLTNDQTYYFWALNFFLDFAVASNSDINLIKNFLSSESFHFVQTSIDNSFEHLFGDKKKTVDWVKRIHLILKAYRSLLETLLWMDYSKDPLIRSISREIKSQIFYVVEYREMTLHVLMLYDPTKFSVAYLRDLIETTHLFIKLLEEFSKQTKLVVQKVTKKKLSKKKRKKVEQKVETPEEKWEKIKDDVYDSLCCEKTFPEIPPFDATLEIPIDSQKGRAMKNIQKFLHDGKIIEGIGLLRSARQVWPENDCFGAERMSVEDETMALQEICLADFGEMEGNITEKVAPPSDEDDKEENEDFENENRIQIVEQDFDIMDYKKRLVNKKIIEACGILLKNFKKNSDYTNHCTIKLLHRIGWECCMPAMLFQASIFWTLLKIMKENTRNYEEINTFTVNLLRKFRKYATENSVVFLELLFWKDSNVALEIQHGYRPYEEKPKLRKTQKNKSKIQLSSDEEEMRREERKKDSESLEINDYRVDKELCENKTNKERKKTRKRKKEKNTKDTDTNHQNKSYVNHIKSKNDVSNSALKNDGSVSRVLLYNSSESGDSGNDMFTLNEISNPKNSFSNNQKNDIESKEEYQQNRLEEDNKKLNESNGNENQGYIFESAKRSAKVKGKQHNIINTSVCDKEKMSKDNDQNEGRQNFVKDSDDERENTNESIRKENEGINIVSEEHYSEYESVKSRFKCGTENMNGVMQGIEDCTKTHKSSYLMTQKYFRTEKNCSSSSRSQVLNVSSKKRGREVKKKEARHFSETSNEGDNSESKRIRCNSSDSDLNNFESGDEEPISVLNKRRRRRLVVIESDSDSETNEK